MHRRVLRRPRALAHDRRRGGRRLVTLALPVAVSAVLALGLAACGSDEAGQTTSSSTVVSTSSTVTTTTTTTTTTLPVGVPGTAIRRARVAALPPDAVTLPAVSEGSAAWLRMVPIAYRSFGSGPDLLLVAGQDGTLSWWGPTLLFDLSTYYHVTVFDLPGVGYSGAATTRLSLAWLADMTAGFALTIGLSEPIILGWGLGGEIALSLAERHPAFASSLILVDTAAGGDGSIQPAASVVRTLGQPGVTPVALSALLFPDTAAGLLERPLWQSSLFTGDRDWLTVPAVKAQAALQAEVWKTSSLAPGLPDVTIPALVVAGADDVVFPPANAAELGVELPDATSVILPGSGYGAIIQDEPAFVATVEKFTG